MSEAIGLRQVEYVLEHDSYKPVEKPVDISPSEHVMEAVDPDTLRARILEGNDTYALTTDRAGRRHETVLFNADKMANGIVFRPSTSFSSFMKNPAWALESVLLASLYPNVAHLSWGSFGNYPTQHMDRTARTYVARTGRYTVGDGSDENPYRAVDPIKELVDMLAKQDRLPTHFIADQEAGRLVLPMMAELDEGSVEGASLNGIDGIAPSSSYIKAPFMEDMKSRVARRTNGSGETGEATPVNIKELKQHMPEVFAGWRYAAHLAPLPLFIFPLDVRDKINLMRAYRGHNDQTKPAEHAVFHDMNAAVRRQNSMITMQFNAGSSQHESLDACVDFGEMVMNDIPAELRSATRGVRLVLSENGTWAQNTDSPYETAAIRRLGLPGIAPRLAMLAGGLMRTHGLVLTELNQTA